MLLRALLLGVLRFRHALSCGCLTGVLLLSGPLLAHQAEAPPPVTSPGEPPGTQPPAPAVAIPELPPAPEHPPEEPLSEVIVETTEPRYVAPTRRDRIGRIWAPVLIDGKGPYRLVLDTGATRSAVTARTAEKLGSAPVESHTMLVRGFTGSALVPSIHAERLEVGELLIGPMNMPVLLDVFGGAEGVLGIEGLRDVRILADFSHDQLIIARSHGQRAPRGFSVVPLRVEHGGLLVADILVGHVRTKAVIDTGAQGTVGNLMLKNALMRRAPSDAQHTDIQGVTLDIQSGDIIPAPAITFGELTVRNVRVVFGDMYLFEHWSMTDEPALILGMDLLASFGVLIIDYNRQELQIRLRGAS